jgi:hypothetical protein
MRRLPWVLVPVAILLALTLGTSRRAEACDSRAPERYRSSKTVWCVNPDIWAGHRSEVEKFFPYGDQVIDKLQELFGVVPNDLPYTIEVMEANGYAQTPSNYGPGCAVTGDAFFGEFGGVEGYWGYLLVLHELINQWTGLVTGGWPTDWWADHRSPFPNSMDEQVLRSLGQTEAARVQHERFASSGSGDYDPEVVMFNEHFDAYGFAGLRHAFQLIKKDGLSWFELRDPPAYQEQTEFVSGNPSRLLSNYVSAYLSLGAGVDVTAKFLAKTVGQKPPGWDHDWQDTSPSSETVTQIANAHCAIGAAEAAGQNVGSARAALRKGDFASARLPATADCAADCPSECACVDGNECVAPWVTGAVPQPDPDAGPPAPGEPDAGADSPGDDPPNGNPGLGDTTGSCGCRVGGARRLPGALVWSALAILGLLWRRNRESAF